MHPPFVLFALSVTMDSVYGVFLFVGRNAAITPATAVAASASVPGNAFTHEGLASTKPATLPRVVARPATFTAMCTCGSFMVYPLCCESSARTNITSAPVALAPDIAIVHIKLSNRCSSFSKRCSSLDTSSCDTMHTLPVLYEKCR